MKQFLAIYTGTAASHAKSGWAALDEKSRREREMAGMQAWGAWMDKNADATVVVGGPLGKTKCVTQNGVSDCRNNIAGYIVIQAESHDAAAKKFENHPHFAIFPGDSVEIMEVLPLPTA